jgi:hypothetical protein
VCSGVGRWTLGLLVPISWEVVRGGARWNGYIWGWGLVEGRELGRPCGSTARCLSPGNRSTHPFRPAPSHPCHPLWIQARPIYPGRRNWKCPQSPSNIRQPIRRASWTTHLHASAQVPKRRFLQWSIPLVPSPPAAARIVFLYEAPCLPTRWLAFLLCPRERWLLAGY